MDCKADGRGEVMFLSFMSNASDYQYHLPIANIQRIIDTEEGFMIFFNNGDKVKYDHTYNVEWTNKPRLMSMDIE